MSFKDIPEKEKDAPEKNRETHTTTNTTTTTKKAIAAHLESLSKSCTASLNSRNFSRFAPGWNQTSPHWVAEFDNHVDGALHTGHDLESFLQLQRETAERFPEYHMRITGISSDVSDEVEGRASVFTTVEVTGIPPGVVRQSMVLSEYRRLEGRWLCTRCVGVRGVPHLSD